MARKTRQADIEPIDDDGEAIWLPEKAGRFLGVTAHALTKWRQRGGGPTFVTISNNRIGYRRKDLIKWLKQRETQSTSERSAKRARSAPGQAPSDGSETT